MDEGVIAVSQAQQEKYNKRTAANIASLRPDFGVRVQKWLEKCRAEGLNPLIHFGARTVAQQQLLYERYIARKGPRAVEPKKSYHCYGRAIDWVNIIAANGRDSDLDWDNFRTYRLGIKLAKEFNLHSIGDADLDHLQDVNYPSWRDLPKSELIKS